MTNRTFTAALAALGLAWPALAQDPQQPADQRVEQPATPEAGQTAIPARESDIVNLRSQKWSWNDIGFALAVSNHSGRPLHEVVTLRNSGLSWRKVGKMFGLNNREVYRDARQFAKDAKRSEKEGRLPSGRFEGQGGPETPSGDATSPQSPVPGTPGQTTPEQSPIQTMPQPGTDTSPQTEPSRR